MSRRADAHQLALPYVPVGVHVEAFDAGAAVADPYARVRCDVLVRALMATDTFSTRQLARTLDCSPDTVARRVRPCAPG